MVDLFKVLSWHQTAPEHHRSYQHVKHNENWLKLIKVCRCFPDLLASRQCSALVLSLEDEELDAALGIDDHLILQ